MRVPHSLPVIVAFMLTIVPVRSASEIPSTSHRGWLELSLLNAPEAQKAFVATVEGNPTDRDARLGQALAVLQSRSRTPRKIADARKLLETLRGENASDDVGIGAAYYLARIQQVHSFTPDLAAAVAGYRALLAAHPGHHYAQLAAPKLALLLLYDDVSPAEWERRVAEIQGLIPRLTAPESARDTRLILAMALIRLRLDHVRAYPLFAAALAAGSVTRLPRLNGVLVQAAESAQELGKTAAAAGYYETFLANFPTDIKSDEIRHRLAGMKQQAGP